MRTKEKVETLKVNKKRDKRRREVDRHLERPTHARIKRSVTTCPRYYTVSHVSYLGFVDGLSLNGINKGSYAICKLSTTCVFLPVKNCSAKSIL